MDCTRYALRSLQRSYLNLSTKRSLVLSSNASSKTKTKSNQDTQVNLSAFKQSLELRSTNQSQTSTTLPVPLEHEKGDFFYRVLQRFPGQGRCLSFAYGSGVFQQATAKATKDNVTDLIFIVDDPVSWHKANLKMNKSDYCALLRYLGGADLIAKNQDTWGARLHFNTLIPFESGLIKYGVMSKAAFVTDCLDWDHLYASGRLHKPVRLLEIDGNQNKDLIMCLRLNLQSALHAALLLLPESFSEESLYLTLAGLSYQGDFRMVIGEDKNKVSNIVRPSLARFRHLYARRLRSLSDFVEILPSRGRGDQDMSPSGRHHHLCQLPRTLQWRLVQEWNRDGRYRDVEEVLRSAAFDQDTDNVLKNALQKIVTRSSITQAVKGIITAGPAKTITYSMAKLQKMVKSQIKKDEK